jgi:NRPS condensation-like uncharacterized protein
MAKVGRPKSECPKMKIVGIRLADEDHERLKEYASKHNLTMTDVLLKGLKLLLDTPEQ